MSESQNFKGTPRALLPITEQVLAWVASRRAFLDETDARLDRVAAQGYDVSEARASLQPRREDLRRIELCALATREACYFHDLYGSGDGGRSGRSGRIVHRDPADDSGFYVPELPPDDVRHPCIRCGKPTTRYTMGTAKDIPSYVCDLCPHCQEA